MKIFVIDDEEDVCVIIKAWGSKKGHEVIAFTSAENVEAQLMATAPNIVLIDVNLKTGDGRLLARQLKQRVNCPLKVILISGDAAALLEYEYFNADGILNKPFTLAELDRKLLRFKG